MEYSILILIFLLSFSVSSLLAQFKESGIRNFDYLGLLPSFRFFAPRPVTRDIRVYARAFDMDGNPTLWKELFYGEKKWYSFIWNPNHKLRKTVIDIYSDIDVFREAKDIWHISFPYLILLYASTHLFNDNPKNERVEFMITCYAGNEENTHDIIFRSNEHSIR